MFDLSVQVHQQPASPSPLERGLRSLITCIAPGFANRTSSGSADRLPKPPYALTAVLTAREGAALPIPLVLEELCAEATEYVPQFPGEIAANERGNLKSERHTTSLLTDQRGRPAEAFTGADSAADEVSALRSLREEELFYSRGALILDDEPDDEFLAEVGAVDTPADAPFVVRLHSKFESFDDGSHIRHRTVQTQSPILEELAADLSVRRIARLFPARLESVRLGVENYASQRQSGLLGYTPTITDRLYLEMNPQSLTVHAHVDTRSSSQPDALPHDWKILEQIDRVLRRTGVFPDFLASVEQRLQEQKRGQTP